jgi:hypothetical protein
MTAIDKAQTEICDREALRQAARHVAQFYDQRVVRRWRPRTDVMGFSGPALPGAIQACDRYLKQPVRRQPVARQPGRCSFLRDSFAV